MKKGTEIELKIESNALGGKGLGYYNNYAVFVPFAIAGQQIRARIIKKKKRTLMAQLMAVLEPSADEIEAPCPHFGQPPQEGRGGCGGCRWQQIPYLQQLAIKEQQVRDTLQHLGRLENPSIQPILPSLDIFNYRNKMEWSFGDKTFISKERYQALKDKREPLPTGFYLGFHQPSSYSTIIDIHECHLVSREALELFQASKQAIREMGGAAYSTYTQQGFWRHLVIREGFNTGELMVHVNTTGELQVDWQIFLNALQHCNLGKKQLRSVLHSINTGLAQIVVAREPDVLWGQATIEEQLLGLTFQISAASFFQTNTRAAEVLFQQIIDLAELNGHEVVYDLYSGTGAIGLLLAQHGAGEVYGLEDVSSAVQDARLNAERNGIENCQFIEGKVEDQLPDLCQRKPPDVVIIDPPRAGLHIKTIKVLKEIQPPQIIYVSCNPAALARDLQQFTDYQIDCVQPLDMFPHTAHVETIVKLVL